MADRFDHFPRRTLVGATILQIVPSLHEDVVARSAVDVAHALLRAGARALVAAAAGPLSGELTTAGAEWIPMVNATANPFRLRRNAGRLAQLIRRERVDIVHAYHAGAAWSARMAAAEQAVWLVSSLPDLPAYTGMRGYYARALARAHHIVAPSSYAAAPIIRRYGVLPEHISVVPRAVDTAAYHDAAISPGRISAQRERWRVSADDRVIMVPGRVAPWNGQILLAEVARILVDTGVRDFVFVIVGEQAEHARYAQDVVKRTQALDVDDLFRMAGHCTDMPAAYAAADTVALPAIEPPLLGRAAAQAQAAGRPVVTTNLGVLPEQVVAPPRMPEDMRTGWVAKAGEATDFAAALQYALALDSQAYRLMCRRAREFATSVFSPESVADAMRGVYTSLLAREP